METGRADRGRNCRRLVAIRERDMEQNIEDKAFQLAEVAAFEVAAF